MVTISNINSKYRQLIMCNPASSEFLNWKKQQQQHARSSGHSCVFQFLKCSSQQLCVFCFLLYYFAGGAHGHVLNVTSAMSTTTLPGPPATQTPRSNEMTHPPSDKLQCVGDVCSMKISSSKQAMNNMVAVSEHLFDNYAEINGSQKFMDEHGFEKFIEDVGLMKDDHGGHDHGGHDHGGHGHHHGITEEDMEAFFDYDYAAYDDVESNSTNSRKKRSEHDEEFPCYSSVKELVRAYFKPQDEIELTLNDFMTLMPRILLDLTRPECRFEEEHDHGDHGGDEDKTDGTGIKHSTTNIWLISFASVFIISLVSLLGVLIVPMLRHSKLLNHVIAFLVSLAVGTLVGDALLHLLPHASGAHDHSAHGHEGHDHGGHAHGGEEEKDHFDSMWKGLVACAGIYVFFLLETGMGLVRRRKGRKNKAHQCGVDSPPTSSPSGNVLKGVEGSASPSASPLLSLPSVNFSGKTVSMTNGAIGDIVSQSPNGCSHERHGVGNANGDGHAIEMEEQPLETGHHHHHAHVPQTIASLAWMVIVGDGLHNITDGLAIGAAFTGGIGIGLSTVLAIFFHEIPQELGDFAVLLNAGMTVKQALLWNFISACMCFVGLVIGLLIGEYTSGIILWILAFTAGGFLYIALVDMLPAMIKQLVGAHVTRRFIIQNIGLISGFAIMTLIALKEEAFMGIF